MEKNVALRRQAQQRQKEGRLEEALRDWVRILSSNEPDPYDFVAVGDLLLRLDRREEARSHYEEASKLYERLGFIRSAIGTTKKLVRMGETDGTTLLRLAHLHVVEGFGAEAAEYARSFQKTLRTESPPDPEYIELLETLFTKGLRSPDLSLTLVDLYEKSARIDEAARELHVLAGLLMKGGKVEEAERARGRAEKLKPGSRCEEALDQDAEWEDVPSGLGATGAGSEPKSPVPEEEEVPETSGLRLVDSAAKEISNRRASGPVHGDIQLVPPAAPAADSKDLEERAQAALENESWLEAVSLLEGILSKDEERPSVLEKLIEGYRQLGNNALTITALERLALYCESHGVESKALECWNKILGLDSNHTEARLRIEAPPRASEPSFVVVTNQSKIQPNAPMLDVQELLRDFQEQVVQQIPMEDGESHYTLALSHHEMGLYNEALEELDRALQSSKLDHDLEMRCRELEERCKSSKEKSSSAS
ncbi:MAG: hypothetical protein KJ970_10950 [Candidatus Eisenbacteria bacterium]|uniref:Tetratricopeptide repeat protein n=1 Tax=Eiseniibacteriota bacterium TaxID=2212470 RepID=A0A948WD19_UNCEI|nr:hypothetical protein [Candidatus Eisenbacteria bacterium]MBU1948002.1 hypothetical protein [Candidatus Eisenbacteria bacterium]MBU2691433.1 hypothetical protein [Candidatus Eisenbacteria bacterium]